MIDWFEKINSYYNSIPRLWDIEWVKNAVKMGKITPEQYKEITGEEYMDNK